MNTKQVASIAFAAQVMLSAAPSISQFSPRAVLPGKRTVLTFSGSGLSNVSNLWTSFGGTTRRLTSTNAEVALFEVICPENLSGIEALQLAGPDGASNFELLMVDPIRVDADAGQHHQRSQAQRIQPPVAVDGVARSEQIAFYQFSARAGEEFSLEVIAHRIGSNMDPVVRISDASGRELAFCDDEPGIWRDARFPFTAPTDGEYTIAVHDSAFGGGSDYPYRLRVTRDPLIWYTFPLVDPSEPFVPYEVTGSRAGKPTASSPANPPLIAGLSAVPSLAELEPNDSTNQAQALLFPCILNGRIQKSADLDLFKFNVEKDQKLIFQSQTRSLGSPCDLVLTLRTLDGKSIAQSDSNLPDDAAITNKFSEAGQLLLEIRELSGSASSNSPYRIKIEPELNGITASAENNRIEIKPMGTSNLKVTINRFDYPGSVTLEFDSAVEGVTLENNVIVEKKNDCELKIKASDQLKPGTFTHFRLRAKIDSGGASYVSTRPALKKDFPLMLNSPHILEGIISLTVKND